MKTVCFYYTQSGQAKDVADSICKPLSEQDTVIYKQIIPQQYYPFPWSKDEFLNAFPESRLGIPPSSIEPLDLSDVQDADLVIVVGQSWFLSPSLPIQSFFLDEEVRKYLADRKVIFVNACRNMWYMTMEKIKVYLRDCNAHFVGHIMLQDEAPNLVGVITIIRWLLYGKKEATALLPAAGIDDKDIKNADRFGTIIHTHLHAGTLPALQDELVSAGAIHYRPSVVFVEKLGHRIFGFWAPFVRKKGGFGDPRRRTRQNMFFAYLLAALYIVSPFGVLFFYLTYPFRGISKQKKVACSVS